MQSNLKTHVSNYVYEPKIVYVDVRCIKSKLKMHGIQHVFETHDVKGLTERANAFDLGIRTHDFLQAINWF